MVYLPQSWEGPPLPPPPMSNHRAQFMAKRCHYSLWFLIANVDKRFIFEKIPEGFENKSVT